MGEMLNRVLHGDNLRLAWNEIADNSGMAGVDDISIRRWRRNWEERLTELAMRVRANTYRPGPLRVRRIPKSLPGEWRTLRVPTVTDRVLQRAVYQVLVGRCERQFLACSFGYRPRRSLRDAVQRIVSLREQGHLWVLDADIDDFFDQVDHGVLMDLVRPRAPDQALLSLIQAWLDALRPSHDICRGLAMGSPLSPLLANLYLHPLDEMMVRGRWNMVRYADDFVVLTRTAAEAQRAHGAAQRGLELLKLRYHPTKTRLRRLRKAFAF